MSAVMTDPKLGLGIGRVARTKTRAIARVRYQTVWIILMVAALGFVAAGGYTVARAFDAKEQVKAQLAAEHITTSEDASIPNVAVNSAETAQAEADVIKAHVLESTNGKTYAQMDRTDPARQVAFNGAALRTSLLSAVLAFNVANLALGFGAFVAAIGLLGVFGLILLRSKIVKTE